MEQNSIVVKNVTKKFDDFMGEISKIFFQNDLKNGYNLLRYGIISR